METREIYCATCGTVVPFVNPPCPDRHGGDCPEWICTRCDRAILADPPARRPARRSRARSASRTTLAA